MKKCKRLVALTMAVLIAFVCFALPSLASSTASQYGLEASIVTDKESYKANEDIHVTVTVKNTNDFKVENVSMESLLPETLTLKDGSSSTKTVDLEPGETLTLSFTAVKEKEEISATEPTETEPVIPSESETVKPSESESVKPSETETVKPSESETETQQPTQAPTTEQPTQGTTTPITTEPTAPATTTEGTTPAPNTTGTQPTTGGIIGDLTTTFPKITTPANSATAAQAENPDTGDSMSVKTLAIAIIALLAVIAIVIILMYKYKKQTTKIISLVMCVAISASAITGVTFFTAEGVDDRRKSFTVEKVIMVDGEEMNVSATVSYQEFKEDDSKISEPIKLKCNPKELSTSSISQKVYFYAEADIKVDDISLYNADTDEELIKLVDDGLSEGDVKADDGIYSGKIMIPPCKEAKTFKYYALLKTEGQTIKSRVRELQVIAPFTEQEIKQMDELFRRLEALGNESFYQMSEVKRKKAAEKEFESLLEDGLIDNYYFWKNDSIIGFTYLNGLPSAFYLEKKDPMLAGGRSIESKPFSSSLNPMSSISEIVKTNNKVIGVTGKALITYGWDNPSNVDSNWNVYQNVLVRKWEEIGLKTNLLKLPTVLDFRTIFTEQDYRYIVLAEHGEVYPDYNILGGLSPHYAISTGEVISIDKTSTEYLDDIRSGRVVQLNGNYCLTPSFFSFYYEDKLDNTIIDIESCMSFGSGVIDDDSFATAFIDNCGAEAVISYHNSVFILYSATITIEMVVNLVNNNNNITQALEKAKETCCPNDVEYMYTYGSKRADWLTPDKEGKTPKDKTDEKKANGEEAYPVLSVKGKVRARFIDGETKEPVQTEVLIHKDNRYGELYDDYTYVTPEGNLYLELPSGKYVLEVQAKDYVTRYIDIDSQLNSNISLGDLEIYKTSFIPNPDPTPGIDDNFAGGDGSKENPYQIATAAQLNAVRNHMDSHFVLINDIDLSKYNWEPIGGMLDKNEESQVFRGTLDGQGHKIQNMRMYYNLSGKGIYNIGLFSKVDNYNSKLDVSIINLKMVNVDIDIKINNTPSVWVGSISARMIGDIKNCNSSGSIKIVGDNNISSYLAVGGIVSYSSYVENCTNAINIDIFQVCQASVGGISSEGFQLYNCSNVGNINCGTPDNPLVGGVSVGGISESSSEVINCKNSGNISIVAMSYINIGGVVSFNSSYIKNCNNRGKIQITIHQKTQSNSGVHISGGGIASCVEGDIERCVNYGEINILKLIVSQSIDECEKYISIAIGGVFGIGCPERKNISINKCVNYGNLMSNAIDVDAKMRGYLKICGIGSLTGRRPFKCYMSSCYNICNRISSEVINGVESNNIYRIRDDDLSDNVYYNNNYSLNTTTLNGSIPTEDIGPDQKNGGSMTKAEIEKAIQELGFELPGEFPNAS